MPSAEIITIGTELLLGEIVDTNAHFLAHCLREAGIDVYRKTTIGDNVKRIAQAIRESMQRSEIILTTGGLGPTVDDPTREAVALAAGVQTEFHPELWEQIKSRFQRLGRLPTENNRRQAYIPAGAIAMENPVGTAPIFILEHQTHVIIALPGVPGEMTYLMERKIVPYLRQRFELHDVIQVRILHTVGVGESQIDDLIADMEQLSNPTVGLAAHSGQVDVRITVKAASQQQAAELMQPVENTLRERLGKWVYGADQETLEEVSMRSLTKNGWTLAMFEAGSGGKIIQRLANAGHPFIAGQVLTDPPTAEQLLQFTDEYRQTRHADVGLGISFQPFSTAQEVFMVLITPKHTRQLNRRYGGPDEYAFFWTYNNCLDLLRRISDDE
jgi:nicotinamide-nucleotide amidase